MSEYKRNVAADKRANSLLLKPKKPASEAARLSMSGLITPPSSDTDRIAFERKERIEDLERQFRRGKGRLGWRS